MNKSRLVTTVYIFLSLALLTSSANAAVVQYLDRASWSSAVGAVSGTEDFNGFTSDTQFRTQTVALNGMTVSADGVSQHQGVLANKIDVAVFEFSDGFAIDGTPYLLADIELAESGGEFVPINLRFDFNNPLSAWGADLTSFPTAAIVSVEIFGPNPADDPLASFPFNGFSGPETDFFGFQIPNGLLADHIVFSIASASGFETFGMDNIAFVSAVPIPAAVWLFGSGLLGLVGIARRKKAA